jgi:hypothetical protein
MPREQEATEKTEKTGAGLLAVDEAQKLRRV